MKMQNSRYGLKHKGGKRDTITNVYIIDVSMVNNKQ